MVEEKKGRMPSLSGGNRALDNLLSKKSENGREKSKLKKTENRAKLLEKRDPQRTLEGPEWGEEGRVQIDKKTINM